MAERSPALAVGAGEQAWRALIDVTTGVLATLDGELRAEHGLSLGEYEVLARLSEEPEHSLRMTDLAGRLHLSPAGSPGGSTGWCGRVWSSGSSARPTGAGRTRCSPPKACAGSREAAPTHVRGVRAHFVDQLSARELANLAAALSNVDVDATRAAGGCDDQPGADPEARTAR